MTELLQEPMIRLAQRRLLCSSTGKPIEPLQCWCCSGMNCTHKDGAFERLIQHIRNHPEFYADKRWVYRALHRAVPVDGFPEEVLVDE